jgi:FMN phosphatase YigB (HAD superfamily)
VVFLDVGGVLYEDRCYFTAIREALRDLGAEFTDEQYAAEYDRCRNAQSGSFRARLARRFLPGADPSEVTLQAAKRWLYPPEALLPDVRSCLEELRGRYRLGVIANQQSWIRDAMRRDGIERFFEIWAVSEDVGFDKPDRRLFEHALREAHAEAVNAVMCGDRLDYDIRPAKDAGMRTVWVLRGEAPNDPTSEQLEEPDAAVGSLADLPETLERLR